MMVKYLLLMMCCSFPAMLSAQHFVIRADKMNKVYIGMENRLTVVSGSCGCDALAVTADKGTITKIGDCTYSYAPTQSGSNAELLIFENKGGKAVLIGKNTLRVKAKPEPVVTVGGKTEGDYPLGQFKLQAGLTILVEDFQYDKPYYKVSDFTLVMIRGSLVEKVSVTGNLFNNACQRIIAGLKTGDRILIENIHAISPDHTVIPFNSIAFTMK